MRYYSRVGPRASTCEKVLFSTFSLSEFFELERNWIWLASVRRWAVSWVIEYFFIQFYVIAIFHNDWTPEMKRWKERLCIISAVFNWHSTSVFSTEFNTELNTISTRLDDVDRMKSSTRRVQLNTAWKMEIQHRLYITKKLFSPLSTLHFLLFTLHFSLFREWKG